MNETVRKIADAVLYEGYILYPYRASAVKNRRRFDLGVLFPADCAAGENGRLLVELIYLGERPEIDGRLRFLRLGTRSVETFADGEFRAAERLEIGGRTIENWQEATECEIALVVGDGGAAARFDFRLPAEETEELVRAANGAVAGRIVRRQAELAGEVTLEIREIGRAAFRLTIAATNVSRLSDAAGERPPREVALASSMVSAHLILTARAGRFASLLDPPAELAEAARECRRETVFPVLVGDPEKCDTMLCAPVILYDFPAVAPESAGDLFDGAEIDELLTLRILTLSDEEKRAMRSLDARARALLERTEKLSAEDLLRLHGRMRENIL